MRNSANHARVSVRIAGAREVGARARARTQSVAEYRRRRRCRRRVVKVVIVIIVVIVVVRRVVLVRGSFV